MKKRPEREYHFGPTCLINKSAQSSFRIRTCIDFSVISSCNVLFFSRRSLSSSFSSRRSCFCLVRYLRLAFLFCNFILCFLSVLNSLTSVDVMLTKDVMLPGRTLHFDFMVLSGGGLLAGDGLLASDGLLAGDGLLASDGLQAGDGLLAGDGWLTDDLALNGNALFSGKVMPGSDAKASVDLAQLVDVKWRSGHFKFLG